MQHSKLDPHALFKAQDRVDDLIRDYVGQLLNSRDALEKHVKVIEAVIASENDPLIVFGTDGKITFANRAAICLIGCDPRKLRYDAFFSRYKFYESDGVAPVASDAYPYHVVIREKRAIVFERLVTGPNLPPEGLWFRISDAPILDESANAIGVVSTWIDISRRKYLERQRNSLAALITHDIKNHLAAEDMTLSMLDGCDHADKTMINKLRLSAQGYLNIATTLLELYRADLYQMENARVPVNISQLIQDAVELNADAAMRAQVVIELSVAENLPVIEGIPSALRQVFHNLIQNAIQVSHAGQMIQVVADSDGKAVVVRIQDDGPGIAQDILDDLFKVSRVTAKLPKSVTSTGYGLYLSRLIVEDQGGKISCESHLAKGTTFKIELPVNVDSRKDPAGRKLRA